MTIRRQDRLTYAEVVCDYFAELRGRGLLLSPVDMEIVAGWEAEGIPIEVVCRGLRRGCESHERGRPGVRPPHRLAYYAPAVRDAWRHHLERDVGGRRGLEDKCRE